MCNLSKGVREKGRAEGIEKGRAEGMAKGRAEGHAEGRAEGMAKGILDSIRSLIKNLGISAEQAMAVLEVPLSEQQMYLELLEGK